MCVCVCTGKDTFEGMLASCKRYAAKLQASSLGPKTLVVDPAGGVEALRQQQQQHIRQQQQQQQQQYLVEASQGIGSTPTLGTLGQSSPLTLRDLHPDRESLLRERHTDSERERERKRENYGITTELSSPASLVSGNISSPSSERDTPWQRKWN